MGALADDVRVMMNARQRATNERCTDARVTAIELSAYRARSLALRVSFKYIIVFENSRTKKKTVSRLVAVHAFLLVMLHLQCHFSAR